MYLETNYYWCVLVSLLIGVCLCIATLIYLHYCRFRHHLPLFIQTFCGYDEPYHPSVLFFPKKFGEYHYWMVETPLPVKGKPYRDRWECPCIHVSQDGYSWKQISPDSFPLDNLDDEEIKNGSYHSDPHLLYAKGRLECWYRFCEIRNELINKTVFYRRTSVNGKEWSPREKMCEWSQDMSNNECCCDHLLYETLDCNINNKQLILSPAILYRDQQYLMWTCLCDQSRERFYVSFSSSEDGKHWEPRTICILEGYDQVIPWHLDVYYHEGIYYLLIYDYNNREITLWTSSDRICFKFKRVILQANSKIGCFYQNLYRSSLVNDGLWKIYFSAACNHFVSIGLLEGDTLDNLVMYKGPKRKFRFLYCYVDLMAHMKNISRTNPITKPLISFAKKIREIISKH